jgi:hypothetical protein
MANPNTAAIQEIILRKDAAIQEIIVRKDAAIEEKEAQVLRLLGEISETQGDWQT